MFICDDTLQYADGILSDKIQTFVSVPPQNICLKFEPRLPVTVSMLFYCIRRILRNIPDLSENILAQHGISNVRIHKLYCADGVLFYYVLYNKFTYLKCSS